MMEVEAFLSPTYAGRLEHGQRNVSQWLVVAPPLPCLHAGSRFPLCLSTVAPGDGVKKRCARQRDVTITPTSARLCTRFDGIVLTTAEQKNHVRRQDKPGKCCVPATAGDGGQKPRRKWSRSQNTRLQGTKDTLQGQFERRKRDLWRWQDWRKGQRWAVWRWQGRQGGS